MLYELGKRLGVFDDEKDYQVFMVLLVMDLAALLTYYMAFVNRAGPGDMITYVPIYIMFGMLAYAVGSKK